MLTRQAMAELGSHAYLAFAAGLLSVLSPCVLPLMPAYLSLISGISVEEMHDGARDSVLRRRVMLSCLAFVSGFSAVFVLLGVGRCALRASGAHLARQSCSAWSSGWCRSRVWW